MESKSRGIIPRNITFLCVKAAPIILFSKIRTGQDFGSQISLNIVKEIVVVDELDKGHISRRPPSVEDNLR